MDLLLFSELSRVSRAQQVISAKKVNHEVLMAPDLTRQVLTTAAETVLARRYYLKDAAGRPIESWETLCRRVADAIAAGVLNSWIWIGMLSYREVTMALTLYTRNNVVISTVVWQFWGSGWIPQVSALGVVLILFAVIVVGSVRVALSWVGEIGSAAAEPFSVTGYQERDPEGWRRPTAPARISTATAPTAVPFAIALLFTKSINLDYKRTSALLKPSPGRIGITRESRLL